MNAFKNFDLTEMFKSYCEVLQAEHDNWYGNADYLILSLPKDVQDLFHYIVDDFRNDFEEFSK